MKLLRNFKEFANDIRHCQNFISTATRPPAPAPTPAEICLSRPADSDLKPSRSRMRFSWSPIDSFISSSVLQIHFTSRFVSTIMSLLLFSSFIVRSFTPADKFGRNRDKSNCIKYLIQSR